MYVNKCICIYLYIYFFYLIPNPLNLNIYLLKFDFLNKSEPYLEASGECLSCLTCHVLVTRSSLARNVFTAFALNVLCTVVCPFWASSAPHPLLDRCWPPTLVSEQAPFGLLHCFVYICSIITAYLRSILRTHENLMDLWPRPNA